MEDAKQTIPRGPRILGMSGGTLLTAAFFMPVAQVCDKPERGYELGFDWGGVNPGFAFGLVVLIALIACALRGREFLPRAARLLRVYVLLWGVRDALLFTYGFWDDFIAHGKPFEKMSAVGLILAIVPIWLIRATFARYDSDTQIFGRMMWLGGVLWVWWIALGFDHGMEKLLYGFWVMLVGVIAIVAAGVWIERGATDPPVEASG